LTNEFYRSLALLAMTVPGVEPALMRMEDRPFAHGAVRSAAAAAENRGGGIKNESLSCANPFRRILHTLQQSHAAGNRRTTTSESASEPQAYSAHFLGLKTVLRPSPSRRAATSA
jgi:hypothetical protein